MSIHTTEYAKQIFYIQVKNQTKAWFTFFPRYITLRVTLLHLAVGKSCVVRQQSYRTVRPVPTMFISSFLVRRKLPFRTLSPLFFLRCANEKDLREEDEYHTYDGLTWLDIYHRRIHGC